MYRPLYHDIRAVANVLNGEVIGRNRVAAPGPGHRPHDRSLVVTLDHSAPDGFVTHSFAGDDWRVCKDHVRQMLGIAPWEPGDGQVRRVPRSRLKEFDRAAVEKEIEKRERTPFDLEKIRKAQELWDASLDARGTPVEAYLKARALTLAEAGTTLRFNPRTPWRDENTGETISVPALIAAFHSIDDGILTAIHRMRLDQPERWPKIDRRMLGITHRAAVKLSVVAGALSIAEGIETAMAANRLGYGPAWALGSAGAIGKFPVLDGINTLRILGERCATNTTSAGLCAQRWHAAGRKVQVGLPKDERDKDFNDQVMREAS